MKTRNKQILTYILIFVSLNVFGQTENHIDSLTTLIDKNNPSKIELTITSSIDSLVNERIIKIEKQTYKTLCKYILKTNNTGAGMRMKFIELYLSNDNLIKASVFYDMDKHDFWKMLYFKDNTFFYMLSFPRCMRISLDENGQEYVDFASELTKQSPVNKELDNH